MSSPTSPEDRLRALVKRRLRQVRAMSGRMMSELSELVGVHPNTWSTWESDSHRAVPTIVTIGLLSRELGFSIDWFLRDEEETEVFVVDRRDLVARERSGDSTDPVWGEPFAFVVSEAHFVLPSRAAYDALDREWEVRHRELSEKSKRRR